VYSIVAPAREKRRTTTRSSFCRLLIVFVCVRVWLGLSVHAKQKDPVANSSSTGTSSSALHSQRLYRRDSTEATSEFGWSVNHNPFWITDITLSKKEAPISSNFSEHLFQRSDLHHYRQPPPSTTVWKRKLTLGPASLSHNELFQKE